MMYKELRSKDEHFKNTNALLESAKFPEAIEKMRSWSKEWLIQFIQAYPENYQLFKHEDFDTFWAERRANLNSKFTFVKQNKISDINFVLGYIFYLMACKAKENKNEEQFNKYLGKAIKYDSIHAAQTLLHNILMHKSTDQSQKIEILASVLYSMENLAIKHGTPGYLLLANGYFHLLQLYSSQQNSDIYTSTSYYLWYNMLRADIDESQSEASILNAYFGKGLSLSNAFRLTTIKEMKEKCAPFIVDETTKVRAENQARQSFRIDEDATSRKARAWLESRTKGRMSDVDIKEIPSPPGM